VPIAIGGTTRDDGIVPEDGVVPEDGCAPATPHAMPPTAYTTLHGVVLLADGTVLSPCTARTATQLADGTVCLEVTPPPSTRAALRPSAETYAALKVKLDAAGEAVHVAAYEAEAAAAWLAVNGQVAAVFTTDSDAVAYGAPLVVCNYGMASLPTYAIDHAAALAATGLTAAQFREACILCGTDFNDRIRGFGPAKIFPAMKGAAGAAALIADGARSGVAQLRTPDAQFFAATLLPRVVELFATFCGESAPLPNDAPPADDPATRASVLASIPSALLGAGGSILGGGAVAKKRKRAADAGDSVAAGVGEVDAAVARAEAEARAAAALRANVTVAFEH